MNSSLDNADRRILKILQENNLTPQRTIGEKVHLSAAAVQRRIKRLQEEKIIQSNIAILNPLHAGSFITLIVMVELTNERLDLLDAAKASFLKEPEVQQCYYVTGDSDFVLVIVVPSMFAYEALTRRIFFENQNVKHFYALVVMDRVKANLSIPII